MKDCGTTVIGIHHIKKPSEDSPKSLDGPDFRKWFLEVRGPRALINGSDVRLGVDTPDGRTLSSQDASESEKLALILRGFGRIRGDIGPIYISRAFDDQGDPLGYRRLSGIKLLFNSDQVATYEKLPNVFTFKQAKQAYGKTDQPTREFLLKCISLSLLKQPGKGQYEKLALAE